MGKHRNCYQLTFGYANIINNSGYYDEAVEYYIRTIDLHYDFLPAYECIAYIYEYKRIDTSKSLDWAQKALSVDPNSLYCQFVVAKNEKDIDQRIIKVK